MIIVLLCLEMLREKSSNEGRVIYQGGVLLVGMIAALKIIFFLYLTYDVVFSGRQCISHHFGCQQNDGIVQFLRFEETIHLSVSYVFDQYGKEKRD